MNLRTVSYTYTFNTYIHAYICILINPGPAERCVALRRGQRLQRRGPAGGGRGARENGDQLLGSEVPYFMFFVFKSVFLKV